MNFDLEQIKRVIKTDAFSELRKFLIYSILELSDIDEVKNLSNPIDQAVELKAQKKAYQKLVEMFSKIMSWSEGKVKKDRLESIRNDFGL